jgi:AmiR/NasT family two-component response regulator
VVHQAAGMLAVQLGVPVAEALVRLRVRAIATHRPISQVAAEVVTCGVVGGGGTAEYEPL